MTEKAARKIMLLSSAGGTKCRDGLGGTRREDTGDKGQWWEVRSRKVGEVT